jgi:hypothetical protein
VNGGDVGADADDDFATQCGWNTWLGRLRENATEPLARMTVSGSGALTVASPTAPAVTLRVTDVLEVVPMNGSGCNPLRSSGLAIHRATGQWDYVWCRGAARDCAAEALRHAGFPVRESRGGVWAWWTVFGAGRAPM